MRNDDTELSPRRTAFARSVFKIAAVVSLVLLLVGIAMIATGKIAQGAYLAALSAFGLWSGWIYLPRKFRRMDRNV